MFNMMAVLKIVENTAGDKYPTTVFEVGIGGKKLQNIITEQYIHTDRPFGN